MTMVKICGISRVEHGLTALEAGADMLGFIFYPPSHRYVTPAVAGEIVAHCREQFGTGWQAVGVFVNEPLSVVNQTAATASLDLVQLAGDENGRYCAAVCRPVVKVVRVDIRGAPRGSTDPADWGAARILLDTDRPGHFGGTGETYHWQSVRPFARRALLAGGLSPDNAAEAIRLAQPWGLDVSSGVERNKQKDPALIRRFLYEVKGDGGNR